jgi:hypothetical protein
MRMKAHMLGQVRKKASSMFKLATQIVRESLEAMCLEVDMNMTNYTNAIFSELRKDYTNAIKGVKFPKGYVIPPAERLMRKEVAQILNDAGVDDGAQDQSRGDN